MAALTAATQRTVKTIWSAPVNFAVANAVTIYVGGFCMLPGTSGDTANRGYLDNYANVNTAIWTGYCISAGTPGDLSTTNTIVGNTSPAAGNNVPQASTETGPFILPQYAVIGASAQSDVGKKVYGANNNDITLTANVSQVVGRVVYFWSSSSEDVMIYGMIGFDLMTS